MNGDTLKTQGETFDPRQRFAAPPFPQPEQDASGSSNRLDPQADYGESTYTGSGKLAGRAALISRADSGIGRAVALCFASGGADVLFAHLPVEADDAQETVRLVEGTGGEAVAVPGDIQSKAFCEQLVSDTVRAFGRLDVLVNNAAFQRTHEKLEDIPENEFDTTLPHECLCNVLLNSGGNAPDEAGRGRAEYLFD